MKSIFPNPVTTSRGCGGLMVVSQNRFATHTMSFSSAVTINPTTMVAKTSVIQSCKDRGGAHDR
eukprot:SAG31_NODE_3091_length_4683_cov_47.153578_6_plen_64_part_00